MYFRRQCFNWNECYYAEQLGHVDKLTVLNGAHINKNCIVGAGAVVSEGKEFPEGSLILGVPARAVKELTPEQIEHIQHNADEYCKISKLYKED